MKKINYTLLILLLIISSCGKSNRFRIDTSENSYEFKIQRFDSDFILLDTSKVAIEIEKLYENYPTLMPIIVSEIFDIEITDKQATNAAILEFLKDTSFQQVNKRTLETFQNSQEIEQSIAKSFQYIQHYFPKVKIPEIYFFVSGFNRSIIIQPEFIAIGVDMYLGSDYPIYSDITYEYMTYNMRPESIPADVISSILFSNFPSDITQDRLLENMLYRGKIMYILSALMPDEAPNDIFGYNKFQWEWCRKYEKEIWRTMLDQNHLYSTDRMLISKYLNDAPFTATISQDAPGRLGTWVGWQIVANYMDKNKELSLMDLKNENNYQKILNNSGYNP